MALAFSWDGHADTAPFFAVGQGTDDSPTVFLRVGDKEQDKFSVFLEGQPLGSPVTNALTAPVGA